MLATTADVHAREQKSSSPSIQTCSPRSCKMLQRNAARLSFQRRRFGSEQRPNSTDPAVLALVNVKGSVTPPRLSIRGGDERLCFCSCFKPSPLHGEIVICFDGERERGTCAADLLARAAGPASSAACVISGGEAIGEALAFFSLHAQQWLLNLCICVNCVNIV